MLGSLSIDATAVRWWNRAATAYHGRLYLNPPERRILERFGDNWGQMSLLDIGVGTGRTTHFFAYRAKSYVGVDYSNRMIELTKQGTREHDTLQLDWADARDLSRYRDGQFDFVMFSYNGLDYMHPTERPKAIQEIRRVLRPGGHFFFSSHSLEALPLPYRPMPDFEWTNLPRALGRVGKSIFRNLQIWGLNRKIDLKEARKRGWVFTPDGGENFSMPVAYVVPSYQVWQLQRYGFSEIEVMDAEGHRVASVARPPKDGWISYLAKAK
jgi:SAM-dependent methyltransferase